MKRNQRATTIIKGDKRTIRGWIMYDWANSVYQLTIASAIFPIYYTAVTRNGTDDTVSFFGFQVINTVLYSWTIATAYFLVAMLSPLFSSVADYTGRRKLFMEIFTWIGAISCGSLFFFDGSVVEIGILAFGLGTIGYGGSIVFYNSFLPVIAEPKDQDSISARGYSMGYLGGVVLLLFNLTMILKPQWFGIAQGSTLPARISFLTVFLWWIGFAQITFSRLPRTTFGKEGQHAHFLMNGYKELRVVFFQVLKSYRITLFLGGFFFTMMGLLTVMFMAATYGEKEIGIKEEVLILTVLIIQLVGMIGAWFFSKLSGRIGNLKSLMTSVFIWIIVCGAAFFVRNVVSFVAVAMVIGFVMGGTQALARSTYAKLLPVTTDHTSFFSFYDVLEKLATVGGLFSFGIIEAITGSMRFSVLAITIFFALGLIFFLYLTIKDQSVKRA